jgi:peroxiredoxin
MPSRRSALSLALSLAAAAPLLLTGCDLVAKQAAPAVNYVLLDGAQARSADWAGKVMLVNFWATSCATCVKEMPQIVATHEKFKAKGFDTLAVAMSYDPPAFVARFAETRKLPFAVAIDHTGQIAHAFGQVQMTPTTFLINKRGEIVKRYFGEPDFTALHALIATLLKDS